MAFTVEDGTGVSGANSYLTVVDFKSISDTYGKDYSAYTDPEIQTGLVQATYFLDSYARSRYSGTRKTGQGLEWPRENASYYDGEEILSTVVPFEIQLATVETFFVVKTSTNLYPEIAGNGVVKHERVRVEGAVEEERRYESSSIPKRTFYSTIEDALSRITGGQFRRLTLLRVAQ